MCKQQCCFYFLRIRNMVFSFYNIFHYLSRLVTKQAKWHVRWAKTHISLGIRPVWSESSLSTWRKLLSLATHWAHSEDSDQAGRMPRLIWVFTGRTCQYVGFVMRRLNYYSVFSSSCCYGKAVLCLWFFLCVSFSILFSVIITHLSRLSTKLTKWPVRPAKTQIRSESSLSARRKLGSLATQWAHSEDSDQTGRMPRLIWVFARHTYHFVGFVTKRLIYALWTLPSLQLDESIFQLRDVPCNGRGFISPPPSILILTVPRRYFCYDSLLLLVLAVRIYTLVQLLR